MEDLKPNEYRCAHCQGVFTKTRTDEEAVAEMNDTFADMPPFHDDIEVCDDCYKRFMEWYNSGGKQKILNEHARLS